MKLQWTHVAALAIVLAAFVALALSGRVTDSEPAGFLALAGVVLGVGASGVLGSGKLPPGGTGNG